MPAHWFRVGYARNALVRCGEERAFDAERLSVRSAVSLMERFADEYRAQHVDPADDVLSWEWGTDAATGEFRVTARRTLTRRDDGRRDDVALHVLLRGSAARRALGTGRSTETPASLRASRLFALTADATPLRMLLDDVRLH